MKKTGTPCRLHSTVRPTQVPTSQPVRYPWSLKLGARTIPDPLLQVPTHQKIWRGCWSPIKQLQTKSSVYCLHPLDLTCPTTAPAHLLAGQTKRRAPTRTTSRLPGQRVLCLAFVFIDPAQCTQPSPSERPIFEPSLSIWKFSPYSNPAALNSSIPHTRPLRNYYVRASRESEQQKHKHKHTTIPSSQRLGLDHSPEVSYSISTLTCPLPFEQAGRRALRLCLCLWTRTPPPLAVGSAIQSIQSRCCTASHHGRKLRAHPTYITQCQPATACLPYLIHIHIHPPSD